MSLYFQLHWEQVVLGHYSTDKNLKSFNISWVCSKNSFYSGVGKLLMKGVKILAQLNHYENITLYSKEYPKEPEKDPIEFYKKLGFLPNEELSIQHQDDHYMKFPVVSTEDYSKGGKSKSLRKRQKLNNRKTRKPYKNKPN